MEDVVTLSMLEQAQVPNKNKVLDWTKAHFTIGEVSRVLHLAPRTVSRWFDEGLLQGYRFPLGERRVARASLLKLMHVKGFPVHLGSEEFRIILVAVPVNVSRLVQSVFGDRASVAEASSIFHAGQLCGEYKPAFVVLDLSLGKDAIIDTVIYLSRMSPKPRIVLLSSPDSELSLAGIDTFAYPCDPAGFINAIREEARGRRVDL